MNSIKQLSICNYKHCQILMVLVLMFLGSQCKASNVSGDTSKINYPINDPRNPNCPCHQYQKIADDEYNRILEEQKLIPNDTVELTSQNSITEHTGISNAKKDHVKHRSKKIRRRKSNAKRKKIDRIIQSHHWNIFSRIKDPTACFKWR